MCSFDLDIGSIDVELTQDFRAGSLPRRSAFGGWSISRSVTEDGCPRSGFSDLGSGRSPPSGESGIETGETRQSSQLEPVEPFGGIFIERQGCQTTSPDAKGADQGVFECSDPIAERNNGVVDLLLILNFECVSG